MTALRSSLFGMLCASACCAALAALVGCSSIRVRRVGAPDLLEAWRESVVASCEVSPRTQQTLRTWDLDHVYRRHPEEAIHRLHAAALEDPQPDLVFALAEMNYVRGRQVEKRCCSDAISYYYLSAGYAYHFLFDDYKPPWSDSNRHAKEGSRLDSPATIFGRRFRLACDLYNAGLAKCIAAAQRVGELDPGHELRLPTRDGKDFNLSVVHAGFSWKPEEFGPLLFSEDFEVTGLANQHRSYGLGVPLIGTRSKAALAHPYYPPEVNFPVTAFFRFEGSLADLGARRAGRLELYNPLTIQAVDVGGRPVPLETDLTTPFAYYLAHARLDGLEYKGFLFADKVRSETGIYMLDPYQRGKIPVVLVHGLLSSPLTWAPVFNDLQADPILRERYQFWVYFYPTGDPYLDTAANLRRNLVRLRADLDPQHQDRALEHMVFVGHSMGGLNSRLLTVDGGDDFWRLVSDRPLDNLKLEPQTREELRDTFYFKRLPFVERVIFLGTPHHGSKLSPSLVGRLADRLVSLPRGVLTVAKDVVTENPDLHIAFNPSEIPTSVDLLAPKAPALEVLAARPKPPGVHYHSIIGVAPANSAWLERLLGGGRCEVGDGVVSYESAHLDGVDSELVVPADHMHLHHHPLAILEVRRILLEHYQEFAGKK